MTDEQIIKLLEFCVSDENICKECPYYILNCTYELTQDALALIKRQREEIAKLEMENAEQDQAIINALHYMKVVRAEAIREFAERLKGCIFERDDELIDEIARQMTEEQK